jgi:hypothetical protein
VTGAVVAVAAVIIIGGCLLGAASMVLRAARVHAAAVDRQRDRRPFPALAPEYQEDRPQRRRPRRRRGRLLLLAVIAAAALYWYAGPAATAGVSRLAHGHDGAGPAAAAVIIAVGFAALLGWSLSRRRYPRNHGW